MLKRLYHRWYASIGAVLRPGKTLELGGGSGNLKEYFPAAVSSDIVFCPWLDAVLDAHTLPFRGGSLDNLVLFDVLHHLGAPMVFFREAERVLRPKGRIIMIEPYVSWGSFLVYRFLHAEGMAWRTDPFRGQDRAGGQRDPFRGNQAVPTLIFEKYRREFGRAFPGLRVLRDERTDPILYPLSGGFHHPGLCPPGLWRALEHLERRLRPLNRCLGFRMFVVLEKTLHREGP
jgi:SAM-dependent methyltransferase